MKRLLERTEAVLAASAFAEEGEGETARELARGCGAPESPDRSAFRRSAAARAPDPVPPRAPGRRRRRLAAIPSRLP